ncbi:MAG: MarR family transcriptional regulator [Subtercola sp.]|nr:MarR family transcriptional regulator [Subtercola sp.]
MTGNGLEDLSPLVEAKTSPSLLLAVLGGDAMRRLRKAHTDLRLKPRQFELLGLLDDAGPMSQATLASKMNLTASALVVLLNPLEAAGEVERTRDPENRKRNRVTITDGGRARLLDAAHAQHEIDNEFMAPLNSEQRQQLATLLKILRDGDVVIDESCDTPRWVAGSQPSA